MAENLIYVHKQTPFLEIGVPKQSAHTHKKSHKKLKSKYQLFSLCCADNNLQTSAKWLHFEASNLCNIVEVVHVNLEIHWILHEHE